MKEKIKNLISEYENEKSFCDDNGNRHDSPENLAYYHGMSNVYLKVIKNLNNILNSIDEDLIYVKK